jgi:hypothetical protein
MPWFHQGKYRNLLGDIAVLELRRNLGHLAG